VSFQAIRITSRVTWESIVSIFTRSPAAQRKSSSSSRGRFPARRRPNYRKFKLVDLRGPAGSLNGSTLCANGRSGPWVLSFRDPAPNVRIHG
jgi:hypothetical protein